MSPDHCVLDPACELGVHDPADHPCGRRNEQPGEPCRHCAIPIPLQLSDWEREAGVTTPSCPNCWQPATPALLKPLLAPHGITVNPDGTIEKYGRGR